MIARTVTVVSKCRECKEDRITSVMTEGDDRDFIDDYCPKCEAKNSLEITGFEISKQEFSPEDVFKRLSDMVNTLNPSVNNKKFVEAFMSEHRTLQQNIFRLFIDMCEQLAKNHETGRYDLRNEASTHLAYNIMQLEGITNLPYV